MKDTHTKKKRKTKGGKTLLPNWNFWICYWWNNTN